MVVVGARTGSAAVQWIPGVKGMSSEGTDALQYAVENIFAPVITQLTTYLTILGIWMSVAIPYMPMIFFGLACVGWIIHILYAVCGLPLWALIHMIPERTFVGSQTQGYVTILTLFMRPIFIIVGFWMAEIIAGPILIFLTDMFFSYQGTMSIAYSSSAFTVIFTELITFIWKFIAFLFLMTSAIYLTYGLVFSVADQVQQWIGSGLNGGQWGETNSKEAFQKFGGTAGSLAAPAPMSRRPPPPGSKPQSGSKPTSPNSGGGGAAAPLGASGSTSNYSPPMNMPVKSASFGNAGNLNGTAIAPSGSAGSKGGLGSANTNGSVGTSGTSTVKTNSTFGLGTNASISGNNGAVGTGTGTSQSSVFNKPNASSAMSFGSVSVTPGTGYTQMNNSDASSRFGAPSRAGIDAAGRSKMANRVRTGLSSTLSKFKRK